MIEHVLRLAAGLQRERTVVVLAPDMADVAAEVERGPQPATIAFQEPQLGTGHALMVARDHLPPSGEVLVLYGDTPLLLPATLDPAARGRGARPAPRSPCSACARPILRATAAWRSRAASSSAIVEERHADDALRQRGLCNAGIMAFDAARLGRCSTPWSSGRPRTSTT